MGGGGSGGGVARGWFGLACVVGVSRFSQTRPIDVSSILRCHCQAVHQIAPCWFRRLLACNGGPAVFERRANHWLFMVAVLVEIS